MKTRTLQAVALAVFLLPSTGCFSLWGETIDAMYQIDDDLWVAVKPFKDPNFPHSAWDSPVGHELAMRTTDILLGVADHRTVPYSEILELMIAPSDEEDADDATGLDVRSLSDKEFSDLVGADFVLVCKILRFELKDPNNINMTQGTAIAECSLFKVALTDEDVEVAEERTERDIRVRKARRLAHLKMTPVGRGGHYVATKTVSAKYPDDYLNQYGSTFLDPALVRDKLITNLAKAVAKLMYEHEPEEGKGTGN
jgi:hypothetical protein